VTRNRASNPSLGLTLFSLRTVLPENFLVKDEVYYNICYVIA
jgi:hypothetical protein